LYVTERKSSLGEIESASEADNSLLALVEQSPAVMFRNGRQKVSKNIPSHEQLMAIKCRKKVIQYYGSACKINYF
jgi:hypothetical protein